MRSLLLGTAAVLSVALIVPAVAADIPMKAGPRSVAPVMVAAPNWAGFYLGAHGGYGSSDFDGLFDRGEANPDFVAFGSRLGVKGAFGGVQAGYLFQTGAWVYGGELSASFMNWSDRTQDVDFSGDRIDAKISNLVIATAKLGYAFNNMLLYGAVGAARADAKWTACDECGTGAENAGSVKLNRWGLALGGGVEMVLAGPWSFGVDGTYVMLDDRKSTTTLNVDSDPRDFAELKNIWTIRGVINYRFR